MTDERDRKIVRKSEIRTPVQPVGFLPRHIPLCIVLLMEIESPDEHRNMHSVHTSLIGLVNDLAKSSSSARISVSAVDPKRVSLAFGRFRRRPVRRPRDLSSLRKVGSKNFSLKLTSERDPGTCARRLGDKSDSLALFGIIF